MTSSPPAPPRVATPPAWRPCRPPSRYPGAGRRTRPARTPETCTVARRYAREGSPVPPPLCDDLGQRSAPRAAGDAHPRRIDLPARADGTVHQRLLTSAVRRRLRHRGERTRLLFGDRKGERARPRHLHPRHRRQQPILHAVLSRPVDGPQQHFQWLLPLVVGDSQARHSWLLLLPVIAGSAAIPVNDPPANRSSVRPHGSTVSRDGSVPLTRHRFPRSNVNGMVVTRSRWSGRWSWPSCPLNRSYRTRRR